jgi:NADH-quinone oxidoreductase subunit H
MAVLIYLITILTCVLVVFYAERKLAAFIQDRLGPMEVGLYGSFQAIADLLKMVQKEDIIPNNADVKLFKIAPILIFLAVFAGYAAIPLTPDFIGSNMSLGLYFVLSIVALDVIGLLMAGWSSNNKYALFGAMRAIAQIVSYEIPIGLSVLAVVMTCQTLDLQEICFQQGIWINEYNTPDNTNFLFGLKSLGINTTQVGGFVTWNIFRSPILLIAFIIYFISSLAECNRAPFDIPEAESELVAGYHVEYSGFRFGIFFLAEYAMMLLTGLLASILFLGGWNTPFPNIGNFALANWTSGSPGTIAATLWGGFWILSKSILLLLVHVWIRWTFPRLRIDQLMHLCWKILTPISILTLLICGIWRLLMI